MKHLYKVGRRVRGFVFQDNGGEWWYAIGKPSQTSFGAFSCKSLDDGMRRLQDNIASCDNIINSFK